jgi:hypothetical protein
MNTATEPAADSFLAYLDSLPDEPTPGPSGVDREDLDCGPGERPRLPPAKLTRLSDVTPEEVQWLWPGRIPLSKLTLIAGDPGLGKSYLTLALAANVSRGGGWPDSPEAPNPPGSVILLCAEDGLADTLQPRLATAGADLTKIHALEGVYLEDGSQAPFDVGRDVPRLEWAIAEAGDARLVVIDPITSFTGKTDDHKNAEVRKLLMPLVEMAKEHSVAVVLVSHLNKNAGVKAAYRTMGSLAYSALARSHYLVSLDPCDPDRRLMLPVKNNLASDRMGLAFRIADNAVQWIAEPVTATLDEIMAAEVRPDGRRSEIDRAKEFLNECLAGGPVEATEVQFQAEQAGISKRTLDRAKRQLSIQSRKGKRDDGSAHWVWGAGTDMPPSQEECQTFEPGSLGSLGDLDPLAPGSSAVEDGDVRHGHPIAESSPATDDSWRGTTDSWPEEAREDWEERAAIMEAEGGLDRESADRAAYALVSGRHNPSHSPADINP